MGLRKPIFSLVVSRAMHAVMVETEEPCLLSGAAAAALGNWPHYGREAPAAYRTVVTTETAAVKVPFLGMVILGLLLYFDQLYQRRGHACPLSLLSGAATQAEPRMDLLGRCDYRGLHASLYAWKRSQARPFVHRFNRCNFVRDLPVCTAMRCASPDTAWRYRRNARLFVQ